MWPLEHRVNQMILRHQLRRTGDPPLARGLLAGITASPRQMAIASWLLWLLCAGGYALWALHQHYAPGGVPWVGTVIRVSVGAAWLLVVREWLMIKLRRRQNAAARQGYPQKRGSGDR